MKITIDTKEDSHDEIKRVITMLSSLVGKEVMTNQGDIFTDNDKESSNEPQGQNMFSMFSTPESQEKTDEETEIKPEPPQEEQKDVDLGIPEFEEYD